MPGASFWIYAGLGIQSVLINYPQYVQYTVIHFVASLDKDCDILGNDIGVRYYN